MKQRRSNKKISLWAVFVFIAVLLFTQIFATGVFADKADEPFEVVESIWTTLAIPFGYVIRLLNKISPAYIITLLFFAIVMKLILFPLGIKQQKNMVKQASLKPKEVAIRKKYAGRTDKPTQQKVQQEIMDLYQKENFNPMGGCLPLLLQMPILFALFQVVYNPLRFITNLSVEQINKIAANLNMTKATTGYDMYVVKELSPENFDTAIKGVEGLSDKLTSYSDLPNLSIFGINLAETPSEKMGFYLLIPVLTFVIVYLTSVLTRKFSYQPEGTGDAKTSGCIMDIIMPLMSAFFAFTFPAVLGIYWMFQNILGVLQQIILKKMYPAPVFTEEDYAKAEKEILGKAQKNKKNNVTYKRHPKSLHHIDDDDDDEPVTEQKSNNNTQKNTDKKTANPLISPAPIKDGEDLNDN